MRWLSGDVHVDLKLCMMLVIVYQPTISTYRLLKEREEARAFDKAWHVQARLSSGLMKI